jgi:membrane-bound metal-dependent hydrolase YbcI (DUF457 family)
MPSPIGHALGGVIAAFAVGRVFLARGHGSWSIEARALGLVALAACLPDIDFLWGRHNMETHSLGFALIVGAVALAYTRGRVVWFPLACTLAVVSHVLFDWLGSDDAQPLGVMALWPFSNEFYFANVFLFEPISRQYWKPHFLPHNIWAVIKEILLLAPIVVGILWYGKGRSRRRKPPDPD